MISEMTYKVLLNRFLSTDPHETWMHDLFTVDGYVCATNGWAMAYIPDTFLKVPENKVDERKTRFTAELIKNNALLRKSLLSTQIAAAQDACEQVEDVDVRGEDIRCGACSGNGSVKLPFEHKNTCYYAEADCPVCNGSGYEEEQKKIPNGKMICEPYNLLQIGNSIFQYRWLNELVNIQKKLNKIIYLEHQTEYNQPSIFSIGDVYIAMMPVHWEKTNNVLYKIEL